MRKVQQIALGMIMSFSLPFIVGCGDDEPEEASIVVFVDNNARFEGNSGTTILPFTIKLDKASLQTITVNYATEDEDAIAGEDYEAAAGIATIPAGETQFSVDITILGDTLYEPDENLKIILSNATNAVIGVDQGTGTIRNDDTYVQIITNDGYITPISYPGYTLAWSDEFDGTSLNTGDWNYETGASGWGNNELQNYQSGANNATVANGTLTIEAKQQGSGYTSARLTTQAKQSFKYGRIDIRAILPEGQGIWPALWMLGDNFGTVGWPACGETDIMELVGHEPGKVHGTNHWSNNGAYASYGGPYSLSSGKFIDEYHVFTILWTAQSIRYLVDDVQYHVIDISGINAFQNPFFFIFNVAVGGNWPGNPDNSTVFPQRMVVDYVRVFQ